LASPEHSITSKPNKHQHAMAIGEPVSPWTLTNQNFMNNYLYFSFLHTHTHTHTHTHKIAAAARNIKCRDFYPWYTYECPEKFIKISITLFFPPDILIKLVWTGTKEAVFFKRSPKKF
jgi:hypothetical protein